MVKAHPKKEQKFTSTFDNFEHTKKYWVHTLLSLESNGEKRKSDIYIIQISTELPGAYC